MPAVSLVRCAKEIQNSGKCFRGLASMLNPPCSSEFAPRPLTVSLPGRELYRIIVNPGILTLFLKLTTKVHSNFLFPRFFNLFQI